MEEEGGGGKPGYQASPPRRKLPDVHFLETNVFHQLFISRSIYMKKSFKIRIRIR